MGERFQRFTDLEVWKRAREFRTQIRSLAKTWPDKERFMLISQIIRASRSVADNISEGYGRFTYKDQLHFCIQARGSLQETLNHLYTASDCAYINPETFILFERNFSTVEALLNGYITYLRNKLKNPPPLP